MTSPSHPSTSSSTHTVDSYWKATFALCLCSLTHAYLLINVFPYSGYMVMALLGVTADTAGYYAGLLASSFMVGRSLSSYKWGAWADTYGRIPILITSLFLSSIFSVLFGMSTSFVAALIWRGLLGLSNGIVGTSKTLVSELAKGNESLETRGMALVIGMRGWGFLISPAIGGCLADLVKQYPENEWIQRHSHGVFSKWPFLLPNLVGALFCLASILAVLFCVPETLPKRRRRYYSVGDWFRRRVSHLSGIPEDASRSFNESTSLTWYTWSFESDGNSVSNESQHVVDTANCMQPTTMASIWARRDTRQLLLLYWLYSLVIIAVDEAFPLYCISLQAGLGLPEAAIGKLLSLSGILFVVLQYGCYTTLVQVVGMYGSLVVASIVTVPSILFISLSGLFQTHLGDLNWELVTFLAINMAIFRIVANIFFSSITIATNRTVPSQERASMNGLSMLGASISKAIGPALAGVVCAVNFGSPTGGIVVFGVLSMLALLVAILVVTRLQPPLPTDDQDQGDAVDNDEMNTNDAETKEEREKEVSPSTE